MNKDYEYIENVLKVLNTTPITFPAVYIDITGSIKSAILFSRIMYWSEKTEQKEFCKTDSNLREETYLTEKEFRHAKSTLKRLDLINIKIKGIPPKSYYSVNINILINELKNRRK